MRLCDVEGCGRKHKGRGLCDMHFQRMKTTGCLDAPIKQATNRRSRAEIEARFWSYVAMNRRTHSEALE